VRKHNLGEIFHRECSAEALAWTGERLVTGIGGQIESEHLHRYFLARTLCRGKNVLDVASGEGYGTALLAQTAATAIGIELDTSSVEYASRTYRAANLRYIQGDATRIPVETESIDAVVSFETLEHFLEHEVFLKEIRRVLRPSGFLIISTPDSYTYSSLGTPPNPFHRRELTKTEFLDELHREFPKVTILRQRVISGSTILAETPGAGLDQPWVYEQRDRDTFEIHRQLPRSPYLIAIASDLEIPRVDSSVYIHINFPTEASPDVATELARLQAVEAAVREQTPALHQALSEGEAAKIDAAAAKQEIARLVDSIHALETEIERIRNEEASFREEASERAALLTKEKDESRQSGETLGQQLRVSDLLVRQQSLVVQRIQQDVRLLQQDLNDAAEATKRDHEVARILQLELTNLRIAYDEICKLIIPVWLRKAIPTSFKTPLRMLKRAARHE
jgi:SAM-dependent methyltransferase